MSNHELDSLIDKALITYNAEPSAELASRILAETGTMSTRAGKQYKTWSGVGIAAAGLILFFAMPRSSEQRNALSQPDAAGSPKTSILEMPKPIQPGAPSQAIHRMPRVERGSYVQAAMTEQEKLLVALATQHPDQALALIAMNAEDAKPIEERAPALNRSKELDVEALPLLMDKPLPMLATGSETQN